ncbi:hypothetical protein GW17_00007590 [Ensete ventricosum]|nr:hypothetical protein GW17_00007590 [Ensete ventricosum]
MKQVPIVPYGGATSIEGHTLAPHGGVCIDLSLMKYLPSFCCPKLWLKTWVVVFLWILLPAVASIVRSGNIGIVNVPLSYGPDCPGATIGGMCATRCSGSLAVRQLFLLQVVLANGEVIKTGSRARKSAAGYVVDSLD